MVSFNICTIPQWRTHLLGDVPKWRIEQKIQKLLKIRQLTRDRRRPKVKYFKQSIEEYFPPVQYLERYAIKPPGWEQIFTFEVDAQEVDKKVRHVYGVVFDDERITKAAEKFKVAICFDRDEHQKKLDEWSVGFIVQKSVKNR